MDLFEQAKSYKEKADRLLAETRIVELLQTHGELQKMGSYDLGVMLNPDIDFNVVNPEFDREKVSNIVNELVEKTRFGSYHFYDWVKFQKPEFPSGFYIGLQTEFEEEKWKIDIWFLHQADERVKSLIDAVRTAPDEVKKAILDIKQYRNENGLKIQSVDIYKAVIGEGIKNIEEFLRAHPQESSPKSYPWSKFG